MSNISENVFEAKYTLENKPLLATSVERILILNEIKSLFKDLPQPLRFSRMLSILLSKVSTPVEDFDLIAGRCVDRVLTDEEEKIFQQFITSPDYTTGKVFIPSGHCTFSWETVLEYGLTGLKEKADRAILSSEDEDKKVFLTALSEIYKAIIDYTLRYSAAAKEKGLNALAENLNTVANGKPNSFASALQLLWIITLIDCAYIAENPTLTVGRLDKILYSFYVDDIKKGVLTEEKAKEYITDYYAKHNLIMGRGEHQVGDSTNSTTFLRICNFDAPQYLLLAGSDGKGNVCINDLTRLFAECIVPAFKNPVVVVRYVKDMDKNYPSLWKTLVGKALKSSSLMFYNDGNVSGTLKRIGLTDEESSEYAHFGCNWCSTGDNGAWMHGSPHSFHFNAIKDEEERKQLYVPYMRGNLPFSWAQDVVEILEKLCLKENADIEDFYNEFFRTMSDFMDRKLAYLSKELEVRKRKPSRVLSFTDCFTKCSLETAQCFSASAKYHFENQSFWMFGTVVDSFTAIDQLVFIEKKITLKQLCDAVKADFNGYEDILGLCRNAEKYGMDTPLSNKHAKMLAEKASELTIERSRPYFEREKLFLMPNIQSDTYHLKWGELFGATPDGRRKGSAFSQNSRPTNGVCVNGLTGMLNSMLNIPSDAFVSGALNLDVDGKEYSGEEGQKIFGAILATYLNRGGLHAQVSVTSIEELLDAKAHPERHRDLRVRVTGYSGIFVDICERLQNDIIERFK